MKREGIITGTAGDFLTERNQEALEQTSQAIAAAVAAPDVQAIVTGKRANDRSPEKYDYSLKVTSQSFDAADAIVRTATDKKLLEIVSGYFGMWPHLNSIDARVDFATSSIAKSTQLWHRDPEDERVVKVFTYLTDVTLHSGPFSYIPKTQPLGLFEKKYEGVLGRVPDEEMRTFLPDELWRICTGPQRTMIIADTVGFHRGLKPVSGTRILLCFAYTSSTPRSGRTFSLTGNPQSMSRIEKHALYGKATPLQQDDQVLTSIVARIATQALRSEGVFADGWMGASARIHLKGARRLGVLSVKGAFPKLGEDSLKIVLKSDQEVIAERCLEAAGDFEIQIPVKYRSTLRLEVLAGPLHSLPEPDGRAVSILLKKIELISD